MSWVGRSSASLAQEHFGWKLKCGLPADGLAALWLPTGRRPSRSMGVLVDPLDGLMLFFVPLALAAHLHLQRRLPATGPAAATRTTGPSQTTARDRAALLAPFFAYLSLFALVMLLLVVADNLLLMFVGWEIMGLCSYLLIGFWYARNYPDPKKMPSPRISPERRRSNLYDYPHR